MENTKKNTPKMSKNLWLLCARVSGFATLANRLIVKYSANIRDDDIIDDDIDDTIRHLVELEDLTKETLRLLDGRSTFPRDLGLLRQLVSFFEHAEDTFRVAGDGSIEDTEILADAQSHKDEAEEWQEVIKSKMRQISQSRRERLLGRAAAA